MSIGSGMFNFSDVYILDGITKDVGIVHGRNLIIDSLKEVFARDREWHYVPDIFGYPKTPDHTGFDLNAGVTDDITTRIFIGATYRYEQSYLPAINVRQTSSTYHPISFNQNRWDLKYERQRTEDGYGNVDFIKVPSKHVFAGAWDQSFEIKVISRSQEDTAAIADVVMVSLQSTYRDIMERNGLFIKQISSGGENAESINSNDPLFSVSITAQTYSEWRREVLVSNLLERIQVCFEFDIGNQNDVPATGLAIKHNIDLP